MFLGGSDLAVVSILAAGRGRALERVRGRGLGDAGAAGAAVPGHGGVRCHRHQARHAGHLQPQPPGEGRLPPGDVGHAAATAHGKAHLGESKAAAPPSDLAERGLCTYVRYIHLPSDKHDNDFFTAFKFNSEPRTFIIALDHPRTIFICTGTPALIISSRHYGQ